MKREVCGGRWHGPCRGWGGGPLMSTSLAYVYEPEPQVLLLADEIPIDPLSQVQREVQAKVY